MSLTLASALTFLVAFALLVLSPGAGVALIVSRTLARGQLAGVATNLGACIGDGVFLALAILGMGAVAVTLGPLFQFVKYACALYLVWLGIRIWRSAANDAAQPVAEPQSRAKHVSARSYLSDVGIGLAVTLGNPKPIMFYGALLPTLLDVTALTLLDFSALMGIVLVVGTVVSSAYIIAADRGRHFIGSARAVRTLNRATGALLIGTAALVATR